MSDGLTSRLHRSLVYEKQIAQHAFLRYMPSEIAGHLMVQVTAAEGHGLEEIEEAVEAEIEGLLRNPPTDEEIARAKNRIESSHYRQLARIGGFGGRADQLNHFNVFESDAGLINTSLDRCLNVEKADIVRVGKTYMGGDQVRLRVLPETAWSPAATTIDRNIMPGPRREPEFTPPVPERGRLANGMGITVVEQRGMPIVAFGLALNAGASRDPESLPGLAGFTAQMLAEGTESKASQEIAAAFEFIGSRLSVDARREYSLVSAETLSKHWATGLELVAEVLQTPTFPGHELERVRREHLTDLRRGKDEPNVVAEQLMSGLVYPRSSGYGHPIAGTEASVQALTRDDLTGQFRRDYGPANANLIVVGDVDMDEVVRRAGAVFGSWHGGDASAAPSVDVNGDAQPTTIYLVDRPGAPQSVIRSLQTMMPRRHADYFGMILTNYAFGGQFSARLNQNLRQDKGYSYGYQSQVQWYRRPSLLLAGGSVQTGATKESVIETLKEFNEVCDGRPITAEELGGAKDGILRAYPGSFERPGSVLGQLLQLVQFDLPGDYFRSVRPAIEAVTLEDVHRISREWLRPGELKILIVGDRQQIEPGLQELGLPLVHLGVDGEPTA